MGESRPHFMRLYNERLNAITTPGTLEDFAKQAGFDNLDEARPFYDEYVKSVEDMRRKGVPPHIDRMAQETAQDQTYKRTAGEVEARDVQSRADFAPDQRAATAPYISQGIAPKDMIVLNRGGGVQASVRGMETSPNDLARLLGMTEDEYIAAINPDGKTLPDKPFGRQPVENWDYALSGLSERPNLIRTDKLEDGTRVKILQIMRSGKPTGEYLAQVGKKVIGSVSQDDTGTILQVADDFQGKGIGTLLSSVSRAADPFAPSGGLSPGGEGTARKAYQNIIAPDER
jgi:hypothetical protein